MIKRNPKTGQFTKGNHSGNMFTRESSLGNQHAKGNPPNSTTFKKGQFTMDKHPSWKGGITLSKRDPAMILIAPGKRIPRSRYIWEQMYGPLPKGYVIIHLDDNKDNDAPENLEAITRAENLARNRHYA
jgi:hypothetical protein